MLQSYVHPIRIWGKPAVQPGSGTGPRLGGYSQPEATAQGYMRDAVSDQLTGLNVINTKLLW